MKVCMKYLITSMCCAVLLPTGAHASVGSLQGADRDFGNDRFAAGKLVAIQRPVIGDLIAAGSEMEVAAPVAGDALLAGGTVLVSKPISQSLYAAAGKLVINDTVARNVRVAGGRVEFSPISEVRGNVTAMGGEVELKGKVNGYVQVAGGRVLIDAIIVGNVEATSGQVELGPNAKITGLFRYSSREPLKRDRAALTNGGVEMFDVPGGWPVPENVEHHMGRSGSWIWTIGLLLVAALLMTALPGFYSRVEDTLRRRPAMCLLVGFVTLVCTPVAALLFLITLIGVPLGLLTLMLFGLLMIVGYVSLGISLGDWALQRVKSGQSISLLWRVGAAVVGVLLVSLLARIPWLGTLLAMVALIAGVGCLVLQLWTQWRLRGGAVAT
jgi:hypothetical protein